jgi:hypothetical protein
MSNKESDMHTVLRTLLFLVLFGAMFLLSALVAFFVFGFEFGVRIGTSNSMRGLTLAEMAFAIVLGVIVATASFILLKRLSGWLT